MFTLTLLSTLFTKVSTICYTNFSNNLNSEQNFGKNKKKLFIINVVCMLPDTMTKIEKYPNKICVSTTKRTAM